MTLTDGKKSAESKLPSVLNVASAAFVSYFGRKKEMMEWCCLFSPRLCMCVCACVICVCVWWRSLPLIVCFMLEVGGLS